MSLYDRINSTNTEEKTLDVFTLSKKNLTASNPLNTSNTALPFLKNDRFEEVERTIRNKVIDELKIMSIDDLESNTKRIEQEITKIADEEFENNPSISKTDKNKIIENIFQSIAGYGPITPLINDETVSEIMVNGPNQIYVERSGCLELTDIAFRNDQHLSNIIDRIVGKIGRRVDESSPMVDARLPDGSRVNAIIPPLSLKGPILTIRKFSKDPFTVEDLINFGTMSSETSYFLKACVEAKLNMVISGGTGSGKTTTLNVISAFIPETERIVTIEDAAELKLWQSHIIPLESRPKNIEGQGAVTIRDLVKNALRMRPDRIVVGEVRGGEALDMLQAMNTGHEGSLTTGHANSPRDMLARLETMVLMAGYDLPLKAIREQIAAAIDIIVQQTRLRDGTRRITQITEVLGMESDTIVMQDIFLFHQTGMKDGKIIGQLLPTGIIPKTFDRIESTGASLMKEIFFNNQF